MGKVASKQTGGLLDVRVCRRTPVRLRPRWKAAQQKTDTPSPTLTPAPPGPQLKKTTSHAPPHASPMPGGPRGTLQSQTNWGREVLLVIVLLGQAPGFRCKLGKQCFFGGQFCVVANQSGDHPKVKAKFGYLNLAI